MSISEAIRAFLFAKEIEGSSPSTIRNYRWTLARFRRFFDGLDPQIRDISTQDIRAFLHQLQLKTVEFFVQCQIIFSNWLP